MLALPSAIAARPLSVTHSLGRLSDGEQAVRRSLASLRSAGAE